MTTPKLNVHATRIRITPVAQALLNHHNQSASAYIDRHLAGDWGNCDDEDRQENDRAVELGTRTLGVYHLGDDKLWIIADAHLSSDNYVEFEGRMFMPKERYALTVMVPEDY